jgi:hypothetical protein
MSNPYDTSDPRCNAWYKGYDVAMKKVENQFGEKVDLKKEIAELKEKFKDLFDMARNYNYRGGGIVLQHYLDDIERKVTRDE